MTNDSDTGSIVAEATRELIAADGGDVTVVSSSASQVVLNAAKEKIPQLETVRIIDPREDL